MKSEILYEKSMTPVDVVIVLPYTDMGNKMTDKGMNVGLLCSVIGHTVGFELEKWPGNVWEETTEGKERH